MAGVWLVILGRKVFTEMYDCQLVVKRRQLRSILPTAYYHTTMLTGLNGTPTVYVTVQCMAVYVLTELWLIFHYGPSSNVGNSLEGPESKTETSALKFRVRDTGVYSGRDILVSGSQLIYIWNVTSVEARRTCTLKQETQEMMFLWNHCVWMQDWGIWNWQKKKHTSLCGILLASLSRYSSRASFVRIVYRSRILAKSCSWIVGIPWENSLNSSSRISVWRLSINL